MQKVALARQIRLAAYAYAGVLVLLLIISSDHWLVVALSWFVIGYGVLAAGELRQVVLVGQRTLGDGQRVLRDTRTCRRSPPSGGS